MVPRCCSGRGDEGAAIRGATGRDAVSTRRQGSIFVTQVVDAPSLCGSSASRLCIPGHRLIRFAPCAHTVTLLGTACEKFPRLACIMMPADMIEVERRDDEDGRYT
jgi:hypothetical protein